MSAGAPHAPFPAAEATSGMLDETALHRALSDRSRVRILRSLRAADQPLDVLELAESVGLHANTVRSHLAVLEQARLIAHELDRRGTRGRPRRLYRSARRLVSDQTAAPLLELLDGLGFEPELAGTDDAPELRMHRCPFGITPAAPAPEVCRAHVGLIRGAIEELDAPLAIDRLLVFPEPTYCALRLTPARGSVETT
jgi:predicted ArsR family transcriptional regulator